MVKSLQANTGDVVSIPGSERSPGEGNDNPFQYSCLEKSHGQEEPGRLPSMGLQELDTVERQNKYALLLDKQQNYQYI